MTSAKELVFQHGVDLVGRWVLTIAYGEWPGGHAVVTELQPDPAAPEIVCQVRSPFGDEIGIFEYEPLELVK